MGQEGAILVLCLLTAGTGGIQPTKGASEEQDHPCHDAGKNLNTLPYLKASLKTSSTFSRMGQRSRSPTLQR